MATQLKLTNVGSNIEELLEIWTSVNGTTWDFIETTTKTILLSSEGYVFTPPMGTEYYQIRDTGSCGTVLQLNCTTTTTTLPPTTTTTTAYVPPATTTTTTAYVPPATTTTTTSGGGTTTTTTTAYVPPATTTTTTGIGTTTTTTLPPTTTTTTLPPTTTTTTLPPTTTTTTTATCVPLGTLSFNASFDPQGACDQTGTLGSYEGNVVGQLGDQTIIYADGNCPSTPAPNGTYSDGISWVHMNNGTVDQSGLCSSLTTTTTTPAPTTTTTTTIPVQNITIARPLSGSQGTIDLCGESPTDGSVTDLSTVDTNVYFRNSSPIPDDGQQLYSDYACEVPYERSLDALWAMKTANGMGVFDYYDLYITLSGVVDGYFSCSSAPTTTTTTTIGYYVVGEITEGSGGDDVGSQFYVDPTGNSVSFSITVQVTINGSPETDTHSYSFSTNGNYNFSWFGIGYLDSGTDILAKLNSSVPYDVRVNCLGPGDTNCVNLTTTYQIVDTVS